MKKNKMFLLFSVLGLLVACNGGGGTEQSGHPGDSQNITDSGEAYVPAVCPEDFSYQTIKNDIQEGKRQYKDSYVTYLGAAPSTLNYTKTMQSENAQHIANFVDGLVEHDRFGNLVPCLATDTGNHNEDFTEWTFTLRSDKELVWVDSEGKKFADVKAEDFVSTMRVVLNASTGSESAYLPMLIIKGAEEYNFATSIENNYKGLPEETKYTLMLTALKSNNYLTQSATIDDVKDILAFKRVGIRAEGNNIIYTLTQPADYFPTMLTYLPFLPLNYDYYSAKGNTIFGSQTNLLFNGAYLLKTRTASRIVYEKNPTYWDADNVKTKIVDYTVLTNSIGNDFARKEFENGNIDGFTLNSFDTEGWSTYVQGVDGKGTIKDPHHELTYAQEGQGDKSAFFFYVNQNRPEKGNDSGNKLTSLTTREIRNANKAFKYSYFREALFDALDMNAYNARNGYTSEEQSQFQINTYIPKNFITDDSGKDFFDYTVDAYAEKHNVSTEDALAKLAPGQVNQISNEESVAKMNAALEQLAKDDPSIEFPIKVEYTSIYGDEEEKYFDDTFIEYSNERLNGCIIEDAYSAPETNLSVCNSNQAKVIIVPNKASVNSQNYLEISNSGAYSLFVSGWGPDYGDPMTYAHTMVLGGDMAQHLGIAKSNEESLSEETKQKLEEYGKLVSDANKIVSTTPELKVQRYKAFAKAEIYLLEELGLMRPLYQRGQGYSCSISKFVPYRSPRSGYGLSGDKLKGLEILTKPLTACERQRLRTEWLKEQENSK